MADFSAALTQFGELIGLLENDGSLQWLWLLSPFKNTLTGMGANREHLAGLFAALQGDGSDSKTTTAEAFDDKQNWKPFTVGGVKAGFVWNKMPDGKTNDPLHLGIGAGFRPADPQTGPSGTLLLRLVRIDSSISPEWRQVVLTGSLPVESDALLRVDLQTGFDPDFGLHLKLTKDKSTKELALPSTASTAAWDATRLGAFLLRSWVAADAKKDAAQPNSNKDSFALRMDKHFFPLLGSTDSVIKAPLPPLDDTGSAPDFKPWAGIVLPSSLSSSDGALHALWHLRALITGNEDSTFFGGSVYLPVLVPQSPSSNTDQPTLTTITQKYVDAAAKAGPGVWVGVREPQAGTKELVLEFRLPAKGADGKSKVERISLVQWDGNTVQRPNVQINDIPNLVANLKAAADSPKPGASGLAISGPDATTNSAAVVQLYATTASGYGVLDGTYALNLLVQPGKPVRYQAVTPLLSVELPPVLQPEALALQEAAFLLQVAGKQLSGNASAAAVLGAAAVLLNTYRSSVLGSKPTLPTAGDVVQLLLGLLDNNHRLDLSNELSLSLSGNLLTVKLDLKPGGLGGLSLRGLNAQGTFDLLSSAGLTAASLALKGLQLPEPTTDNGLAATLLPKSKQLPGFDIAVGLNKGALWAEGQGTIKLQQKVGPVDVSDMSFAASVANQASSVALTVGVDLALSLGPIRVAAFDLSGTLTSKGTFDFGLRGLALSLDGGSNGITLSGLFLQAGNDYVGGAVVSVLGRFQLSAIGGYTHVIEQPPAPDSPQAKNPPKPGSSASLFLFASLVAPLGGPPWFFITGIAGGFGYNRLLPPSSLLGDHPFMQVMRGDIAFDSKAPGDSLSRLAGYFTAQSGRFWVAAGIQFTCFAAINGKVIVAVSFGQSFSFELLGMLSYGIAKICYFEIDFNMTADAESFLLTGAVSPNSYLLDPSIFSLTGGFAMGVWYGGVAAGDFLVSVGGYHPLFVRPSNYPDLARVGVKALFDGFVHMDVQCFFACTPHVLMAGASLSLYAKFAGISAGLDVYADVLMRWDPFHLDAEIGVAVWFKFCGKHEVHVTLAIHTPPFGGTADIDLWLVSFTVDFGSHSDQNGTKALPLPDMMTRHLNVPATALGNTAKVQTFSTENRGGLFRLDVTSGQLSKASGSSAQDGLMPSSPILVSPEFSFRLRTHLPFAETVGPKTLDPKTQEPPPVGMVLNQDGSAGVSITGSVNLSLCELSEQAITLQVQLIQPGVSSKLPTVTRLLDLFPKAVFGPVMSELQAGGSAADVLSTVDPKKPSVPLFEGLDFVYAVTESPAGLKPADGNNAVADYSQLNDVMPLPLKWRKSIPQPQVQPKSRYKFRADALQQKLTVAPAGKSSAQRAMEMTYASKGQSTWNVRVSSAGVKRGAVAVSPKTLTVNSVSTAKGVVATAPPVSPARLPELMSITLRVTPANAPVPVGRQRVGMRVRAFDLERQMIALNGRTVQTAMTNATQAAAGAGRISFDDLICGIRRSIVPLAAPVPASDTKPLPAGPPPRPIPQPAPPAPKPDLLLSPLMAGEVALEGGTPGAVHSFARAGDAILRAIFLDGANRLLQDIYLPPGNSELIAPAGARTAMFLHAGTLSPVNTNVSIRRTLFEPCGVDSDTAVVAHNGRVFVAHGCVVRSNTLTGPVAHSLDTLSGAQLLRALSDYTVYFPCGASSLLLVVQPQVEQPAPAADQVRWAATGATLSNLQAVVTQERTALLMDAQVGPPWNLRIALGPDWRVSAVVLSPQSSAAVAAVLAAGGAWDLIDDRIQTGAQPALIAVTYGGTK